MLTIQPFLSPARDVTDLSFVFTGGDIDFMLGLALIERVSCDAATLRYKMTMGRMVNFGVPLDVLEKTFHHDHRTLRNWARGMKSRDPDEMSRIFGGRGAPGKTCDALRRYVHRRWDELTGSCRDFRQRLVAEVKQYFDVELSGEWLRQLHLEGHAATVAKEDLPTLAPPEPVAVVVSGPQVSPTAGPASAITESVLEERAVTMVNEEPSTSVPAERVATVPVGQVLRAADPAPEMAEYPRGVSPMPVPAA